MTETERDRGRERTRKKGARQGKTAKKIGLSFCLFIPQMAETASFSCFTAKAINPKFHSVPHGWQG